MKQTRSQLTNLFEEVDKYYQPNLNNFYNDNRQMLGTNSDTHLLNKFGSRSATRVTNTLYSVIMNVDTQFFTLLPQDSSLDMKETDEAVLAAIGTSNLSSVAMSAFKEIILYGSCSVYPAYDKVKDKLVYTLLPRVNSYFETDYNNKPYINSMSETVSPAALIGEYGKLVSSEVKEAAAENISKSHKASVAVWRYFTETDMYVVEEKTQHIIVKYPLSSQPVATARWDYNKNDYYGSSMAIKALTDVRYLQTMEKQVLRQAQLAINPIIVMPYDNTAMSDGLIFNTEPGGVIEYRPPIDGSTAIPQVLQISGDIQMGQYYIDKTEQAISANFFLDVRQFALQAGQQTTATQINAGGSEKLDIILGMIVSIINDFVKPLVERTVQLLFDAGKLENMQQEEYDIEVHSSLLVKAREIRARRSLTAFDTVAQISQMDPSVMDNIDMDELTRDFVLKSQLPSAAIKSKAQVAKSRNAAVEQQQESQQQQMDQEVDQQGQIMQLKQQMQQQ